MRIYALKTCDTCRKAIKALREAGHDPVIVDVRADGVSCSEIQRFEKTFGGAVLNKRSTTWRTLSDVERIRDPVDLLAAHPTLMKRPVIDVGGQLYLGWKADVQNALLGNSPPDRADGELSRLP